MIEMSRSDPEPWLATVTDETASHALEVFMVVAPDPGLLDGFGQFASIADNARQGLREHGFEPADITSGWLHFAAAPVWNWREALSDIWSGAANLPITALVQPPAHARHQCLLQLRAAKSSSEGPNWRRVLGGPSVSLVSRSGVRHFHLMSVAPRTELDETASFTELADDMFARAGQALATQGLTFSDVVRTWIHVENIDNNYAAMNAARNRYFEAQQLARLAASTCVQGVPVGVNSPLAMDLYAVSSAQNLRVEALCPKTMAEAPAYGVAFSRAMRVSEPGLDWLYLSGTASIDTDGRVVAVGNIAGQLDRMFQNVRSLLDQADMGFSDVRSVTMYLKQASFLPEYQRAARAHGLVATVPCAVVVTDICRPEWLCEIELCACRATSKMPRSSG